jgi:hypothetical protein
MSALPPKADITERDWHVRYVPKADIVTIENGQLVLLMDRGVSAEMTPVWRLHDAQVFVNRYPK